MADTIYLISLFVSFHLFNTFRPCLQILGVFYLVSLDHSKAPPYSDRKISRKRKLWSSKIGILVSMPRFWLYTLKAGELKSLWVFFFLSF